MYLISSVAYAAMSPEFSPTNIKKLDRKTINQQISKVICQVKSKNATGTGFRFKDNLIIVPLHLAQYADRLQVIYQDQPYEALYISMDNKDNENFYDCCIYKINGELPEFSPFFSLFEGLLQAGEKVYFAGFPLTQTAPTFHCGNVSCISQNEDSQPRFFTIDATVVPGNSGGPIFLVEENELKLVGIISSQVADLNPIIEEKREILEHLKKSKLPEFQSTTQSLYKIQYLNDGSSKICLVDSPGFIQDEEEHEASSSGYQQALVLDLNPIAIYKECLDLTLNNLSTGIGKAIYIADFLNTINSKEPLNRKAKSLRLNEHLATRKMEGKNEYDYNINIEKKYFGETYHVMAAMPIDLRIRVSLDRASQEQIKFVRGILLEEEKNRCALKYVAQPLGYGAATKAIRKAFKSNATNAGSIYNYFIRPLSNNLSSLERSSHDYLSKKFKLQKEGKKAAIFIRHVVDGSTTDRNLNEQLLKKLVQKIKVLDIGTLILFGDPLPKHEIAGLKKTLKKSVILMSSFQEQADFQTLFRESVIAGQIYVYRLLQEQYNLKFIIGMKSGAIDGPAFVGIPTIFLGTNERNTDERMQKASKHIPFLIPIEVSCLELKKCNCMTGKESSCLLDIFMKALIECDADLATSLSEMKQELLWKSEDTIKSYET